MRIVAIGAVLHHWRMLPKKWSTPLGVAAVAVLIHRGLEQLRRIGAAVGIVAAGAGDLTLPIRHVGRTLQLRSPHLVALQAQLRLSFLRADVLR